MSRQQTYYKQVLTQKNDKTLWKIESCRGKDRKCRKSVLVRGDKEALTEELRSKQKLSGEGRGLRGHAKGSSQCAKAIRAPHRAPCCTQSWGPCHPWGCRPGQVQQCELSTNLSCPCGPYPALSFSLIFLRKMVSGNLWCCLTEPRRQLSMGLGQT